MKVRFLEDFDWQPPERSGHVHIAFKAGMECRVRKICAADAMAAGAAIPLTQKEQDNGPQ